MSQPINRAGTWWTRREDGSWLRWDAAAGAWRPDASGPPPVAPPPPPIAAPVSPNRPSVQPGGPVWAGSRARKPALPEWLEGTTAKIVAGGVALVLALSILMVRSATGGRDEPQQPPAAGVAQRSPRRGPVTSAKERDVYRRLNEMSACLPEDPSSMQLSFSKTNTAKGRIDHIVRGVEGLRGVRFAQRPAMHFLRRPALERKVVRMIRDEIDHARTAIDGRVLEALGAIPPGTDLYNPDGMAGAVAGLYEPKTKKVFVGAGSGRVKTLDELTLAHELEHALADQAFGLPRFDDSPGKSDATLAAKALVEGDAELTAAQYDLLLDLETPRRLRSTSAVGRAIEESDARPYYFLERSLIFPYLEGALFVCELHALGGWQAVNEAYADPPTTTAEILFPHRYLFRYEPRDPSDPPALGSPWKKRARYSIGAADLLWLFQAPGGVFEGGPRAAFNAKSVARWDGGELHVWSRGDDLAVVLGLVDGGDSAKGKRKSPTLCARVKDWFHDAFPSADETAGNGRRTEWRDGARSAVLACSKQGPRLALAPDMRTARRLAR